MEGSGDEHLSHEDFEGLAGREAVGVSSISDVTQDDTSRAQSDATRLARAVRHVESCDVCRAEARLYEAATVNLNQLQVSGATQPASDCPPADKLAMVAAGLVVTEEGLAYLRHAAECDHCGMLLRQASAAFADEFTEGEERAISQLESSQPTWQKELARELSGKARERDSSLSTELRVPPRRWVSFPKWQIWAFGALAAVIVAAILIQVLNTDNSRTTEELLAQAYGEQRNLELRFSGAQHGPVRIQRGSNAESRLNKSAALLEAEALIARGLQKEPNSPAWLQAKGRADLLDGNYEAAIQSLQKALEIEPDSVSLQTDAASAYFQRAELTDRVTDFGKAIELLSKALAKNPEDHVALFNRALVNEKMFLYRQAVDDWEHYLRIDSKSEWANEANQHLSRLRQKLSEQGRSSTEPLLDVRGFLTESAGDDYAVRSRIEDYLDAAIREWLPAAFGEKLHLAGFANASESKRGLARLAEMLSKHHQDSWLSEVIAESASNNYSRATIVLADAVKANASGDFALAEKSSLRATQLFEDEASVAGKSRAQLETIYALDRSGQGRSCLLASDLLSRQLQARKFQWIETQLLLERSNCLSQMGNFSAAKKSIDAALALAHNSGYATLYLRALGIAAALQTDQGDSAAAGSLDRDGLRRYWEGSYPPIRAYQFYSDLGFAAERGEQWNFALALAKEAVSAISLSPQRLGEAFARHRLAKTALRADDRALAFAEFDRATALFAALPQTDVTANYQADGGIELARLDAERGQLDQAWARLSTARKQLPKSARYFTALNFFKTLGELHRLKGDRIEAEKAFRAAVAVTEQGLSSLRDDRERTVWARDTSQVYRSLAEIKWESDDIEGALGVWEWYRGAALRTRSRPAQLPNSPTQPKSDDIDLSRLENGPPLPSMLPFRDLSNLRDKTVVVYLQLPKGLLIWAVDDSGVTGKKVAVSQDELIRLGQRFSEECANPNSDVAALQRDARLLYDLLIDPIADRLPARGLRTLVIETDQTISEIPIAALLNPTGRYLGELCDIVFSRGLLYQQLGKPPADVSSGDRALVVGSPALSGSLVASLEPLGDALQEAQYVASKFRVSMLLTGSRATLETVQHELPESEIFHFAGHALSRSEHAGLLLANPGSHNGVDSGATAILDNDGLASMNLRNLQLAVFSACSTARDRNPGESSSESLVNLFLRAGVSQVIATRWNVDSRITARYMAIFYDNLLSDETVISSVGNASLQLRAQEETRHPYYWAAFTVFNQ